MGIFDAKNFNSEVFARYADRVPRTKHNRLLEAGVFRNRPDLKSMCVDQTGGNYISVPMLGLLGGAPLNYDGSTNITATSTDTYLQSMVVVGRAKGWVERDFSEDITGNDFMKNVANQVGAYWDDVDQATLLSILKGVFSMSTNDFITNHTMDITTATETSIGATTLNSAIQKASGDNKDIFSVAVMHSVPATNLENLNLVQYLKQTDANGVQRDLGLATWNGRTVLIDDSVPVDTSGSTPVYTSYILGKGAFTYCDCGARVPYEMDRDPARNGGEDTLYTRQRKIFAPYGISFTKASMASLSPTDAELETGSNWSLVTSSSGTAIDHKAIPIARIMSLG